MDVLPRIIQQLKTLFQGMQPWQRAVCVVVSGGILCGSAWLVLEHQKSEFRPIASGRVFTESELADAERSLQSAGLTEFRREENRLVAPAKDLKRYNVALQESGSNSQDLGTRILKQYEKLGPFSTDRQRQQLREASLLQELRLQIREVPEVEDAHVAIATSERRGNWHHKTRTTANVTIKPRPGRELSTTLVNSLRHVVANMVPDLMPTDVTVFDVTRGKAFVGELTDLPLDSVYLQRAEEFARQYEQQILKGLSHIPQIHVTVHVDLDTLKSSLAGGENGRHQNEFDPNAIQPDRRLESDSHLTGFRGSNAAGAESVREASEKQLAAAIPRAVRVSVTIPRDYLRNLAARRIAKGERSSNQTDPALMEEEELVKAERIIGRLIPADSSHDAVSVAFIDPIADKVANDPAIRDRMTFSSWQSSSLVICVLAILILACWTMARQPHSKFDRQVVSEIQSSAQPMTIGVPVPIAVSQSVGNDRVSLLRDEIRAMAVSDPSAAAAVLSGWLSELSP